MLKKIFIAILFLIPVISMAQSDKPQIMFQMRDGKVYFDIAYSLNRGLKKDTLYSRALNWFEAAFPYPDKVINIADFKKGEIDGTGIFKIATSSDGHYYWMKFAVNISIHNATYELKVYDVYEKPIEPGISNEYSKIEYRWWDYRQGKPWSKEDDALFKGFSDDLNETMVSLETAMSK